MTPEEMRAGSAEIIEIAEHGEGIYEPTLSMIGAITGTVLSVAAEICERLDRIEKALGEKDG